MPSKKQPRRSFFTRRRKIVLGGTLLVLVASYVFFRRFPLSYQYPNFYGEDGSVYLQNVIDKGWLRAFLTPFNGYFIFGLYLLELVGKLINLVFWGGHFVSLARAFAVTSYLALGLSVSLPFLLLRRELGKWLTLGLVLLGITIPITGTTHVIIGTIGNMKWLFFYAAFLLAVLRWWRARQMRWWQIGLIDAVLALCIYTNANTYLLLPVLALPYLVQVWQIWRGRERLKWRAFWQLLRQPEVISFVALCALAAAQIAYVAIKGIPALPGYLDTPFEKTRAIEVFIGRTVLYGIFFPFWSLLTNGIVLILFTVIVAGGVGLLRGRERTLFFFGLYAAMGASLMFALTRPGISAQFNGYGNRGPDQFFYAQTLIMYVPLLLLGKAAIITVAKQQFQKPLMLLGILGLVAASLVWPEFISRNNIMESSTETYAQNALAACAGEADPIETENYPIAGLGFITRVPRSQVCPDVLKNYRLSSSGFGLTAANNNFLALGGSPIFMQTFRSGGDDLDGITVQLATFGSKRIDTAHQLVLYDASCRQPIRQAEIGKELFDNQFYIIHFGKIEHSKNKNYCFSIFASKPVTGQLAVQLSPPDIYRTGHLTINGQARPEDIVFRLHYNEQN